MCHPAEDVVISRKSPLFFPWIPVKVQSVCCAGGYLHTQRTDRRREVISTLYKYQSCCIHIKCKPPPTANTLHSAVTSNAECGRLMSIWANHPGLRLYLCECFWHFVSHWIWHYKVSILAGVYSPFLCDSGWSLWLISGQNDQAQLVQLGWALAGTH